MRLRLLKPLGMISAILLSGATLLAWTMPWFIVTLGGGEAAAPVVTVAGDVAAPALAALGLAGLALVAALAIAGPVFRIILGVLFAAIGASIALSAWSAAADPITASGPLVTEATGIAGEQSIRDLIESSQSTAWPALTIAIGILAVLVGLAIAATARRWPSGSSRYQAVRLEDADAPRSAVSDWDQLSDGSDPTSR
jgi:uncharacterized membrane protein (TIGR02234 family)